MPGAVFNTQPFHTSSSYKHFFFSNITSGPNVLLNQVNLISHKISTYLLDTPYPYHILIFSYTPSNKQPEDIWGFGGTHIILTVTDQFSNKCQAQCSVPSLSIYHPAMSTFFLKHHKWSQRSAKSGEFDITQKYLHVYCIPQLPHIIYSGLPIHHPTNNQTHIFLAIFARV